MVELGKTTKTLSPDNRYPERDSNRAPLEYKSRALQLRQLARSEEYRREENKLFFKYGTFF
jgi:hypothetical protein